MAGIFNQDQGQGMNESLKNNLSIEEFFRYTDLPEHVSVKIEELLEKLGKQEKEIEYLSRRNEMAWEQVEFAANLLESIDTLVDRLPSRKTGVIPEFQKEYKIVCENSYFER